LASLSLTSFFDSTALFRTPSSSSGGGGGKRKSLSATPRSTPAKKKAKSDDDDDEEEDNENDDDEDDQDTNATPISKLSQPKRKFLRGSYDVMFPYEKYPESGDITAVMGASKYIAAYSAVVLGWKTTPPFNLSNWVEGRIKNHTCNLCFLVI